MKNRSLFVRGFGSQSFPSQLSEVPSNQDSSTPDKPSLPNGAGLRFLCGLLLALASVGLSSCHSAAYYYYKFPEYNYAGRPVPPSKLAQRVMIGVSGNGSSGDLQIVDALRDIRTNVEDTIQGYSISGYSSGFPGTILSFPSELRGYVYSSSDGSLTNINYSTEASAGSVGTFQSGSSSVAIPTAFSRYYGAEEAAGVLEVIDNLTGQSFALNIPNVYKVEVNKGDTVALAMVRNADAANPGCAAISPTPTVSCPASVYRVFKLNQSQYPTQAAAIAATGSIDCQPTLVPVYCAVAVPGVYDQPTGVYFSLDGTTAYVLNCGPECGGKTASVTLLQQGPLNNNVINCVPGQVCNCLPAPPTGQQCPVVQPTPMIANVLVPGGVTDALSDGITLYLAGQSQNQIASNGTTVVASNHNALFGGYLTTMNLATQKVTGAYSIADGSHSKMLFADNNTLWIGSQFCASGVRADAGQNYNCLTMVQLGGATLKPQIVPNVTPGSATAVVPYPNQNNNQYYYGSLTGLCWVQNFNKVYTAYGGQVHIFSTVDGSEINNQSVTVQGTALDVAYMDALTDDAN